VSSILIPWSLPTVLGCHQEFREKAVACRAAGAVAAKISPPPASKKIHRHLLLFQFLVFEFYFYFFTASEIRAVERKILRTRHAIGGRHALLCGVFWSSVLEFWGSLMEDLQAKHCGRLRRLGALFVDVFYLERILVVVDEWRASPVNN
jgi:hypothetical protein